MISWARKTNQREWHDAGSQSKIANLHKDLQDDVLLELEERLGRLHARQRLGVERDHEGQIFGQGPNFFHVENSRLSSRLIEYVLKLSGSYWLGKRNAGQVELRRNSVRLRRLPKAFDRVLNSAPERPTLRHQRARDGPRGGACQPHSLGYLRSHGRL